MLLISQVLHLRCIRIEQTKGTASVSDPSVEISIRYTKHSVLVLNLLWTTPCVRQVYTN